MVRRFVASGRWVASLMMLVVLGPSVPAGLGLARVPSLVAHAPMRPHRLLDGFVKHDGQAGQESTNWSGYVVSQFSSGQPYTAAQGSWVVPAATFAGAGSATQEFSATWVGIGGSCGDAACDTADNSLIQLGTEQDASSDGSTRYYAWFEMLPANSMILPNPVNPGDVMTASLQCVAFCSEATQSWVLSMVDQTQGWTFTQTFPYASSEMSAEWIEEAPSSQSNMVLPLADFGQMSFNATSANGASPNFDIATNGIQMADAIGMAAGQTSSVSSPAAGDAFSACWSVGPNFAPCAYSGAAPQVASSLVAAVLPASRSIEVGGSATVFATIINPGSTPADSCMIAPSTDFTGTFSFQTTNPATNAVTGRPNVPVTISAGGAQTFVISLQPRTALDPAAFDFSFACQGQLPATPLNGINTLLFSASETPVPDVIALAAVATDDGTVHIPGGAGTGAFAVASANVGVTSTLTVSANSNGVTLPVTLTICQTQAGGQCLAPPAPSVAAVIAANATPTFSIFATATGSIPFSPAENRVFVQFTDSSGAVRGSTSVAVATQ